MRIVVHHFVENYIDHLKESQPGVFRVLTILSKTNLT